MKIDKAKQNKAKTNPKRKTLTHQLKLLSVKNN